MDRYDKIPFKTGFGTVIVERLVDLLILSIFLVVSLVLQFDLIIHILDFEVHNVIPFIIGLIILVLGLRFFLLLKLFFYKKIKSFVLEYGKEFFL